MLPMNKICEDIKEFLVVRDKEENVLLIVKTDETRKSEIVLFANDLSGKYNEHVDVKLVEALIINIQDSTMKTEPHEGLLENIDDEIDLTEEN